MDALPLATMAWCAAALAITGVVKGISGIGIPLVGVSLLSLAIPIPQAVALLPVPIIVANAWQAWSGGRFVQTCRRFPGLLVAMALGTALGAMLLAQVDARGLMALIGTIVICFSVLELAEVSLRVPERHEGAAGAAAGFVGGILGGMSSIFGPPLIMFIASLRLGKDEFVATITSIYLFTGVLLGAALPAFGVADLGSMLIGSGLATVPLFAGVALGQLSRRHVSERLFRKVLMVLVLLIGANLLRRAFV